MTQKMANELAMHAKVSFSQSNEQHTSRQQVNDQPQTNGANNQQIGTNSKPTRQTKIETNN